MGILNKLKELRTERQQTRYARKDIRKLARAESLRAEREEALRYAREKERLKTKQKIETLKKGKGSFARGVLQRVKERQRNTNNPFNKTQMVKRKKTGGKTIIIRL